jgi:hypothetical protein
MGMTEYFVGILFFLSLLFSQQRSQEGCGCKPEVWQSPEISYRFKSKYETNFFGYAEHPNVITSETVRSWEKKYANKMGSKIIFNTPRVKKTSEDSIYTLTGYIYHVKMNAHDCDLHLEIGTDDPEAMRCVAEITKENCALQEEVLKQLGAKGFILEKQNTKGVKCTLKGLGFYDGKHPLKESKKHEKGSAWEIHPVISIQIE